MEKKEARFGLNNLTPAPRSKKTRKRRGRGESSGLGKTAGRGGKGQTARSGYSRKRGFEGGQMTIIRRLPKFGFRSLHAKRRNIAVVNLRDLKDFAQNAEIDLQVLKAKGLVSKDASVLRILAQGELTHALTIKAHHFSEAALEQIAKVKGTAQNLGPARPQVR